MTTLSTDNISAVRKLSDYIKKWTPTIDDVEFSNTKGSTSNYRRDIARHNGLYLTEKFNNLLKVVVFPHSYELNNSIAVNLLTIDTVLQKVYFDRDSMKIVESSLGVMFNHINKTAAFPDISLAKAVNIANAVINKNKLKLTVHLLKKNTATLKDKLTAANKDLTLADAEFKKAASAFTEADIRVKILREMPDTDDKPADPSIPSEMKFVSVPSADEPSADEPSAGLTQEQTQEQLTRLSNENASLKARLAKLSEILG
jgi:hypothetical protein